MMFKPPKRKDDVGKLRDSVTHRVQVGHDAKISIGGMMTTVVKVLAIGADGIQVENDTGARFSVLWEHVIGAAGKPEKQPEPLKKSGMSGYEKLVHDLQKMWARTRPGQLAPKVTPEETGYAKLLTKAIDARVDGQLTGKEMARFRVKLDRALLAEKRKGAPRVLVLAKSLTKRVPVTKTPPRPAPVISERDAQHVRLKVAHMRAGS